MKGYRKCLIFAMIMMLVFSPLSVSAASKYGTYGGKTYYYTISKSKNVRIEKRGKKVGDHLKYWMNGTVKLIVDYAAGNLMIPFSIVETMVDDDSVKYSEKSYSSYVYQAKYTTRNIFYYTNKSKKHKKIVLTDEKGKADVFYEFHPVGIGFKKSIYSKKLKSNKSMKTRYYDNKSRNLKRCGINAKHKSREIWSLSTELLTEKWKKINYVI